MATYYKRNAVTTLGSNTAWDSSGPTGPGPAGPPTLTDTAQWDSASQGGGLTGSFGAGPLQYNGSTTSVIHGSGTVTVGDINLTSSTQSWTESGTFDVGTGSTLTWTFYGIATITAGFDMSLTGALTGSSQITLARSGSATNPAVFRCGSTTSTYTGTFNLGANTAFVTTSSTAGCGLGGTALIKVNSTSVGFASTVVNGVLATPVELNASITMSSSSSMTLSGLWTFGSGGAYQLTLATTSFTFSGGMDLTSGDHTVSGGTGAFNITGNVSLGTSSVKFTGDNLSQGGSISGVISGSNGFIKNGQSNLNVSNAGNTLAGTVTVNAGVLSLLGNVLPAVTSVVNNSSLNIVNNTFTCPFTITGSGTSLCKVGGSSASDSKTFSDGALVGFTPSSGQGLQVWAYYSSATPVVQEILISDFPSRLGYNLNANYISGVITGSSVTGKIVWNKASAGNFTGVLTFSVTPDINTATQVATASVVNNQANASHTFTVSGTTANIFALANSGPVTLSLDGSNAGDNEFSAVMTMHLMSLSKAGTGRWIIPTSNPFSSTSTTHGNVTISAGTLVTRNAGAIGASANPRGVTLSGGTLQLDGAGITRTSGAFSYSGGTLENLTGDNTLTAASHTLNANTVFLVTAGSLTVGAGIAGASSRSLTKTGAGTLKITGTSNSYAGTTTVSAGRLEFLTVENASVASSLGTPAAAQATITVGGNATLAFTGTTAKSSTRNITATGASGEDCILDNSGTEAVTWASGGTFTFSVAGTHTLELSGSNTTQSTFARTLANSTSAVSLRKTGAGSWLMSGNMTATGSISITDGTLRFTGTNSSSSSVSVSGGILEFDVSRSFASATVSAGTLTMTNPNQSISAPVSMSGGRVAAYLTGPGASGTITVTSGATQSSPAVIETTLSPGGNNDNTGAVTINGCVDLVCERFTDPSTSNSGRILGNSNTVTVSGTGIMRTKTSATSVQYGKARYNNLVLQSGSQIKIGFAA